MCVLAVIGRLNQSKREQELCFVVMVERSVYSNVRIASKEFLTLKNKVSDTKYP